MSSEHSKRADLGEAQARVSEPSGPGLAPSAANPASPGIRPLSNNRQSQPVPVQRRSPAGQLPQRGVPEHPLEDWTNAVFRPDLYKQPILRKNGNKDKGGNQPLPATGSGQPMPADVQAKMEQSFGTDFSAVRIHEGPQAAAVGALAFAQGTDVHFAPGQYNPVSQSGQELLGHELAHVVQQAEGRVQPAAQAKGVTIHDDASLEREADEMGARAARGETSPGSSSSGQPGRSQHGLVTQRRGRNRLPIQRFGSLEHKTMGDNASNGAEYDLGGHNAAIDTSEYNRAFRLTHGDIVMLSGDFFSPRDTRLNSDGQQEPDPDSLFLLAGIPSMDPGKNAGTWDEVVYAIKKAIPDDPRFQQVCTPEHPEGHPWSRVEFSAAVMAAVDARYLRRAAANDEHFVAPTGTDRGPTAGDGQSAGGSYRAQHEAAILMAYDQGTHANACAREAAAQHFLTDHFAAGHLRTPRTSIRAHWNAIYPLFWDNIRNKIAMDVATWINDNDPIGNFATVDQVYTTVQGMVIEQTASIPPMGFDDLVSLVTHDYDNENGLWVINDLGIGWKLFGDSHLDQEDPDNRTREMCETAVRLGIEDIMVAARMGMNKGDNPLPAAEVLNSVRSQTVSPASPHGSKYGPEQTLPRPDPARASENGVQGWEQPNLDALWEAPVSSANESETYGRVMTASMRGGELQHELAGMAEKFPESHDVAVFTVHPRRGFTEGFLGPLTTNPRAGLLGIINFSPSRGQASFNEDDAVMREINGEDGQGGMTAEQLGGLTLEQRAERIRALISGYCGEDEGETVIQLFETTSSGQRRVLYEMVEGHSWEGDFRNGVFTVDDDLYDALSSSQLDRLRPLIGTN